MRLPAHPRFACQGAAGQAEYVLPAEKLPSQQDGAAGTDGGVIDETAGMEL